MADASAVASVTSSEKSSEILANKKPRLVIYEGMDSLARWHDGLNYLATVLKVDEKNQKCQVKFEDDSTGWVMFKDMQVAGGTEIRCMMCEDGASQEPNQIVLCDHCGQGYHQKCHKPNIQDKVLSVEVAWSCRRCVFSKAAKPGGAVSEGHDAEELNAMKQVLPYQLEDLHWDFLHRSNTEQCYCYCGGSGEWYYKMLQCCHCRQWFHEACVQCLEYPILLGDRFYLFICAVCNGGKEFIKRLQPKWAELAQLVLFNLTLIHNKKYFEEATIMEFLSQHWQSLQLGKLSDTEEADRFMKITEAMKSCKSRFNCGKEIKKKKTQWGLRNRSAPQPPVFHPPSTPCTASPPELCVEDRVGNSGNLSEPEVGITRGRKRKGDEAESSPGKVMFSYRHIKGSKGNALAGIQARKILKLAQQRVHHSGGCETDSSSGTLSSGCRTPEESFHDTVQPWKLEPHIEQVFSSHVQKLKQDMSSLSGSRGRLALGEGYRVIARRQTCDGFVQYLVEWEGKTART